MQADSPGIPFTERLSGAASAYSRRHWRFVVIAMLALLHVVTLRGVSDDGARVLLLAHLGCCSVATVPAATLTPAQACSSRCSRRCWCCG
jgi:hypothetical protein